eukprot:CAMPEP_0176503268 /NCGR_PEP_ID=MMETSP0200_2-20121128/15268_1 /TAXON_ID=947934 /ORGANISM="Chaetoceros sp., Strain GSL56" /LENGTH=538 /DNA_ID=CAMNT_0017902539 /DNA_START=1994 /DNA_END=3610 /DNA_ORIENTATION=+
MENCHENENRHPNVAIAADSRKDTKGLDVTSMKVSELREHLRIRNLDDKGLKKDLQERLQKDLEEKNVLKSERTSTDAVMIPVTISDEECRTACRFEDVENTADTLPHIIDSATESKGKNKVSDYSGEAGEEAAEMEDDNQNEDVPMESGLDMPNSFIEPSKKSSVISMDTDRENHHYSTQAKEIEPTNDESLPNSKSTKKQNLGKKIMRLFSPSKVKSSTTVESNESSKELSKNENDVSGPYNREKTAHHPSDDIQQPVQNSTDHFAPLTDGPVSQIGIQKDVGEPSMFITDDSLVPNILSHDTKDEEHTLMTPAVPIKVSGKIFSSSTAQAKKKEIDEARKARLEKIRSKVKKNHESSTKNTEPESSVKQSTSSSSSHDSAEERKKAIAAKMREKYTQSKQLVGNSASSHKPVMKANRHEEAIPTGVMSPMDTYEISDRDESDSGAESDEHENSPQKKIPKWAQKQNLIPALERQFLDGPNKMDPDTIFPEVSTCDLEAIFGRKKERYLKRKSTGDWRKDRVTASEKLVYKRKMGF